MRTKEDNWLAKLYAIFKRHGVPVRSASALGGVLRVKLGQPKASMDVEIKPLTPKAEGFAKTRRFLITYQGSERVSSQLLKGLRLLTGIIKGVEHKLPPTLEAPFTVGDAETTESGDGAAPFSFCTVEQGTDDSGKTMGSEALIRLTARCNQKCPFCSAPRPHPDPTFEAVISCVEYLQKNYPSPCIILTGGEPTLWKGLEKLTARLLREPGVSLLHIQTNAVYFANKTRLAPFPKSEKLRFFISFHGAEEEIYNRTTGTAGQFHLAIEGIRNIIDAGHNMLLNIVSNKHNYTHLTDWVEAIPRLFNGRECPLVHFSITMCPEHRDTAPDCLVRYSELSPRLEAAVERATELNIPFEPLLSSSHASIPACLIGQSFRSRAGDLPEIRPEEFSFETLDKPWVKAKGCVDCRYSRWCMGLPRPYVQKFGLDELKPDCH